MKLYFPTLMAAVAVLAGCTADLRGLAWGVRFADAPDAARVAFVELRILRGACSSSDELYRGELDGSALTAVMPPVLPAGTYCFLGRARDASCVWYAAGQREVTLPTDESPLIIDLSAASPEAMCPAEDCTAGRCAGIMTDAGPVDSGGMDAGQTDSGGDDAGQTDSGPRDSGPIDSGPPDLGCTGSMRDCDGSPGNGCETNISSDDNHCGSCGDACGAATCVSSSCRCGGSLTYDGAGGCVDTTADPAHCGSVGMTCATLEYCTSSSCVCRPGLTRAGSSGCVDLRNDPMNCGVLGRDCSSMGTMTACRGTCQDGCTGTQTDCARACVDVTNNVMHCGTCGTACALSELCVASTCRAYRPAAGCGACGGTYPNCQTYGANTICVQG